MIGNQQYQNIYHIITRFVILNLQSICFLAGNANMTTFQSLLQPQNLRSLILALRTTHQHSPLPFYILKTAQTALPFLENSALSLSSKISNQAMTQFSGPLTVWSSEHLQRILETYGKNPHQRVILKNPYKSIEVISDSLQMGVSQMVIDSLQEFEKIENFKHNHSKFKNKRISYYWSSFDTATSFQDLSRLSKHIQGIYFGTEESSSPSKIEKITQKILDRGLALKQIFCEGRMDQLKDLQQWQKQEVKSGGSKVRKTIDLCDFSEVENFILATKPLCRKRTIIHEQARNLIGQLENSSKSLLVEHQNEEWLLSAISSLPFDQPRYLFDIERSTVKNNCEQPQAMAF